MHSLLTSKYLEHFRCPAVAETGEMSEAANRCAAFADVWNLRTCE